ncbi:hypothetical protein Tco_1560778 [Tanacetum coccineum]
MSTNSSEPWRSFAAECNKCLSGTLHHYEVPSLQARSCGVCTTKNNSLREKGSKRKLNPDANPEEEANRTAPKGKEMKDLVLHRGSEMMKDADVKLTLMRLLRMLSMMKMDEQADDAYDDEHDEDKKAKDDADEE